MVGTLVKIIPGERHCHRAHVWRAQETHRNIERLRTWKNEWLGACRKCDGFDVRASMKCRTVKNDGYHTDSTRKQHGYLHESGVFLILLGGFLLYYRRSLPRSRFQPLQAVSSRVSFLVGVRDAGHDSPPRKEGRLLFYHINIIKSELFSHLY